MAAEDIAADADFSFLRRDGNNTKECSVDIEAVWFGPKPNTVHFEFRALIECKYRSPEKFTLLLEEPVLDYSSATLGYTANSFDYFIADKVPSEPFYAIERGLDVAYKGLELHEGGAIESEFRHGIEQLRYATPALLKQTFDSNFSGHNEDVLAIFFTKILVTNSPLWLLNRDVNIEAIKAASDIEDIAKRVETVVLYSDYGPDYEDHFRNIFSNGIEERVAAATSLRERLALKGKKVTRFDDPVEIFKNYAEADRFECREVSTQFFVTTLNGFPKLISDLKNACILSYKSRKKCRKLPKRKKSAK